jgi:hypothetical protein
MLAQAQIAAPNTALGIIAQRTASITWREARQADAGYAINDIDPITGSQRYPFLRWDDTGVPFSSNPAVWQPDPTDPHIRTAMTEQLTTMNSIASCAKDMLARGLNDAEIGRAAWEFTEISNYYEFNSGLRTIHDAYEAKWLETLAANDLQWRITV